MEKKTKTAKTYYDYQKTFKNQHFLLSFLTIFFPFLSFFLSRCLEILKLKTFGIWKYEKLLESGNFQKYKNQKPKMPYNVLFV